jgi:hypothetical protein
MEQSIAAFVTDMDTEALRLGEVDYCDSKIDKRGHVGVFATKSLRRGDIVTAYRPDAICVKTPVFLMGTVGRDTTAIFGPEADDIDAAAQFDIIMQYGIEVHALAWWSPRSVNIFQENPKPFAGIAQNVRRSFLGPACSNPLRPCAPHRPDARTLHSSQVCQTQEAAPHSGGTWSTMARTAQRCSTTQECASASCQTNHSFATWRSSGSACLTRTQHRRRRLRLWPH